MSVQDLGDLRSVSDERVEKAVDALLEAGKRTGYPPAIIVMACLTICARIVAENYANLDKATKRAIDLAGRFIAETVTHWAGMRPPRGKQN